MCRVGKLASLLALATLLVGCAAERSSGGSSVPETAATPAPTVSLDLSRFPDDLPRLAEEPAVIDALASTGFRVDRRGASKFEGYILGDHAKRGRLFDGWVDATPARVDVLFLDSAAGDIRVCPVPSAGPYAYSVFFVDGRSRIGGSAMYFASSAQLFVLTSDPRLRDALSRTLDLSTPGC